MDRRKRVVIAVLLFISISNYFRIKGNDSIRPIQFVTIFAIGALSAMLLNAFVPLFRNRK